MDFRFAFGKTGIAVSLSEHLRYTTVESRAGEPLQNVKASLREALEHPIGRKESLSALARGKRRVAIVVCDITRPAPNSVTLPAVLEHLDQAGVERDGITILIATGLHRSATENEINQIVGPEIAHSYKIISNDARGIDEHCDLGVTRHGTPVRIHKEFVSADLRITLGFIEQHLMAGFSGGRKLVAPGVAAEATIKALHSPRFMRHPQATEGSILENPLHRELLEIARMAGQDFILDVTLTRERTISGVFAGDPVMAHEAGVRFLCLSGMSSIREQADLVITSAAGFPLDLTFYQTVKAITAAGHLAKPGGRIMVVSECAEGIGSPEFTGRLRVLNSFSEFLEESASGPVEIDQWQLEKLALAALEHDLFFFTPGADAKGLGVLGKRAFRSVEDAIAAATAGLSATAKVALIPDGPYTFARVES